MLAACLCFKDSSAYLEEWLLFHYVQGFRRFYLYDNDSGDDWRPLVQPWVEQELAIVRHFPGRGVQTEIYHDCLQRARGEVDWLAFVDDDEFLFPVGDETLAEVVSDYDGFAGVAVSWVVFGSNGHESAGPQWVIERFPRSAGIADAHVKCIVRPERVTGCKVLGHMFHATPGFQVVDEQKRPLAEPLHSSPSADRLRINHYPIKSWNEWRPRRSRPRAGNGEMPTIPEATWRELDRAWAAVDDRGAQRYLPSMRRMQCEMQLPREPAWRFHPEFATREWLKAG